MAPRGGRRVILRRDTVPQVQSWGEIDPVLPLGIVSHLHLLSSRTLCLGFSPPQRPLMHSLSSSSQGHLEHLQRRRHTHGVSNGTSPRPMWWEQPTAKAPIRPGDPALVSLQSIIPCSLTVRWAGLYSAPELVLQDSWGYLG